MTQFGAIWYIFGYNLTPELRAAITKRNSIANISKQNPDYIDLHNEYKKFRNYLTSALRNAQLEQHSN